LRAHCFKQLDRRQKAPSSGQNVGWVHVGVGVWSSIPVRMSIDWHKLGVQFYQIHSFSEIAFREFRVKAIKGVSKFIPNQFLSGLGFFFLLAVPVHCWKFA